MRVVSENMENLMTVVDRLDELKASSVGRSECNSTRQGRTGCGGRPSGWHDIVTCQRLVIIRGAKFKCSIDQAKRTFYRAANGIFAKIGRLASEEVMV